MFCVADVPIATAFGGGQAAISLHKCVPLFFLSRKALIRTAQVGCGFLGVVIDINMTVVPDVALQFVVLNGVMFLGSIMFTTYIVLPSVHWYRDYLGIDPK